MNYILFHSQINCSLYDILSFLSMTVDERERKREVLCVRTYVICVFFRSWHILTIRYAYRRENEKPVKCHLT